MAASLVPRDGQTQLFGSGPAPEAPLAELGDYDVILRSQLS